MPDVDALFREYVEEHRAGGEADPARYLERVADADRRELEALIAAYLRRAPGKSWDPDAFAGSPAAKAVDSITASWGDWELAPEPEPWTELLPTLRERAKIKRSELVERLAQAIGVPDQAERVGAYYHQMEIGRLPSEGVSDRVLEALGRLLGESAARLRAAGSAIGAGENAAEVSTRVAFARTAIRNPEYEDEQVASLSELSTAAPGEPEPEPDEVDRLFTGGPDATG